FRGLPEIVDRNDSHVTRPPFRHGTQIRAPLQPVDRGVKVEQPVIPHETGGAETDADGLRARMRIELRMARGSRLRRGYAVLALQVAMSSERDRRAGKHDELFRTAGKRHVNP